MDDNAAERSLRGVLSVGKLLLAVSDAGGERAATIYSLIGSAKLQRACHLDSSKPEPFTQKDLDELRRNLAHLSIDAVRRFYESSPRRLQDDLRPAAITEAGADAGAGVEAVVEVAVIHDSQTSARFHFYAVDAAIIWLYS